MVCLKRGREVLAAFDDEPNAAREKKHLKAVGHLLGIPEEEAGDRSLTGRLALISQLRAARQAEIARGQAKSWLYDLNRHLNICAALRTEYEALTSFLAHDANGEAGARQPLWPVRTPKPAAPSPSEDFGVS